MGGSSSISKQSRLGAMIVLAGLVVGALVLFWPRGTEPTRTDVTPGTDTGGDAATGPVFNITGMVPLKSDGLERDIIFFFDEAVSPMPGDAPALTIEPPVDGEVTLGSNYVAFRAAGGPISGAVPRVVELSGDLRSVSGKALNPSQRRHVLAPAPFVAQALWNLEELDARTVLGLSFTLPVSLDAVRQQLSVSQADGHAAPFTLEEGTSGDIVRVVLDNTVRWPVTVTAMKGLGDASGSFSLADNVSLSYPADMTLAITSYDWNSLGEKTQMLFLEFSQAVDSAELAQRLSISDSKTGTAVPFTVQTVGRANRQEIATSYAVTPGGNVQFVVKIAAGLSGSNKTQLQSEYVTTMTGYLQELQFENRWWSEEERDGLVYQFSLSYPVELNDLKQHVSVEPPVTNVRVEKSWGSYYTLKGDFDSDTTYTITLEPGLKYGDGSTLASDISMTDTTGDVPQYVGFGQEGKYYFPRRAGLSLNLESRNIEKADVSLHRMFPSNVAVALSAVNEGRGGHDFIESWSEELTSVEVPIAMKKDRLVNTPIDLDGLFPPDKKGAFCIQASAEDWWGQGTKIVLWTDMGVIAHWESDELVLFAHNLNSLEPIRQAHVMVYSTKNQLLGESETNDVGIVQFSAFEEQLGEPRVAVVQKGDDYTFLELRHRSEDPVAYAPEMPDYDREGYDAFVYADRELYRPGETVHLRWLVRTNYGDAVPNVPLLINILKPTGTVLLSEPVTLSDLGGGSLDVQTEKAYPTGLYTANVVVPGEDEPIGTYTFNVEEFVPARIKSVVTLDQPVFTANVEHSFKVNAQHLFGAPAAERRVEARIAFSRDGVVLDSWKDYYFGNDSEFVPDSIQAGEQTTDANGDAAFRFTYAAPGKVTFPMQATVIGRVFELGGRAVSGRAKTLMFPSDLALGIRALPRKEGGVEVMVAAVSPDQSAAGVKTVKVSLERQVWNYYVRRYYSNYEPRWSESFEPYETKDVALTDGKGTTTFEVGGYGYFRVKVHSDDTPQYSTQSFYSYDGDCSLVDSARPSLIKVVLDKEKYAVGETATARVESPFDGQGIVVLQGERIYSMQPVAITDGVGVVAFPVTAEHFPNLWVEATVVHAVQGGKTQLYPFSSAAMANVRVENPARALNVSFPTLPAEVLPHTTMSFDIRVQDATGNPAVSEITLAAVDEGIHLITDYESPDPIAWLSRSRKPDYRRAHYYDRVAYDFDAPAIGGDEELAARAGAAEDSWIKPLALWSGVVRTDETGQARVTFDIPEFTGQLRLVAVGATSTALGSSSSNFFVRRPHLQRLGLPRFLLPTDKAEARVVLFNTTDTPVKAHVTWATGGALTDGTANKEIEIGAKAEVNFTVPLSAKDSLGSGTIAWTTVFTDATGQELSRIEDSTPIPVYAPATYQSYHEVAVLNAGESVDFTNTKFIDDDRVTVQLSASANPLIRLDKALEHVVGYPYGCIEQTTSRLLPMYLLKQSEDLAKSVIGGQVSLPSYISSGINRLFAMQTPSGGLGFWPGSSTPSTYGSVYALHFLTLVKKGKDFDLPETSYEALMQYVRGIVADESDQSAHMQYTRAYGLYVLSLNGDLAAIEQLTRFDDVAIPRPARLMLAAALAASTGDTDRVKEYLTRAPSEPYVAGAFDATFGSNIRNTAVELMMLQQIDPRSEEAVAKANELVAFLDTQYYGTTQESAFVISALTTYLMSLKTDMSTAQSTILEQDKEVAIAGDKMYFGKLTGPGRKFRVSNTGQMPVFVNLTLKGVPAAPDTSVVEEGMTVTRTMYTSAGSAVTGMAYNQGESYVVKITMRSDDRLEHVAVTDLLPAGFEIENPRLDPESNPKLPFATAYEPSYRDIRDDRLVAAFEEVPPGEHAFYYIVRAVTPGTYQRPGTVAECMYDARYRARSAPETVEVARR